jgi:hypothetical protein
MHSFSSLFPPWRDTRIETTTIRENLIDSNGNKMAIEKSDVLSSKQP